MSVAEMKEILKTKIDSLPDKEVEKVFAKIISSIGAEDNDKIDLHKLAPGIFDKYDGLMQKLA